MIGPEDPVSQSKSESENTSANEQSTLQVPLSEHEFILNAGHYDQLVYQIAQEWKQLGFAREVERNGYQILVVDTEKLVDWMETSLQENVVEKVRTYLAVALTLLLSPESRSQKSESRPAFLLSPQEKPPAPRLSLLQKMVQVLRPASVEERAHSVQKTLRALEQEIRQMPDVTYTLKSELDTLLIFVQSNLGLVEEEGYPGLVAEADRFSQKIDRIENKLLDEMALFSLRAEYYAQRIEVATHMIESLRQKLDPNVWLKHSAIMEERLAFEEAVEVVKALFPQVEEFKAFLGLATQALELLHQVLMSITSSDTSSEKGATIISQLTEAEKLLMKIKF